MDLVVRDFPGLNLGFPSLMIIRSRILVFEALSPELSPSFGQEHSTRGNLVEFPESFPPVPFFLALMLPTPGAHSP